VAFVVGFQNNAAYGRIWEARKIWGGIVNSSRSFAMLAKDVVTNEYTEEKMDEEEIKNHIKVLVYRHIAWLTALRHSMRQSRPWEVFFKHKSNREWGDIVHIPERELTMEEELEPYLSKEEKKLVLGKTNTAATVLFLQSSHLRRLKERGVIWEFSFLEMESILREFFTFQGQSERIKNFPYPRQYATLGHLFVWLFILFLPFGVIPEFDKIGLRFAESSPLISQYFVWGAIPFCVLVSWVFHTMERIGRVGENPFEGSANDVPISTISRGIEIDLREMLGEKSEDIPEPFPVILNIQF
jgi:putative membrane protein